MVPRHDRAPVPWRSARCSGPQWAVFRHLGRERHSHPVVLCQRHRRRLKCCIPAPYWPDGPADLCVGTEQYLLEEFRERCGWIAHLERQAIMSLTQAFRKTFKVALNRHQMSAGANTVVNAKPRHEGGLPKMRNRLLLGILAIGATCSCGPEIGRASCRGREESPFDR